MNEWKRKQLKFLKNLIEDVVIKWNKLPPIYISYTTKKDFYDQDVYVG